MEQNTTDVTETIPTMNNQTRTKIKTATALLLGVAVAGLVIDDQIRKFKARKTVKVTVVDKSAT